MRGWNEDDPCDNIPEECYISSNTDVSRLESWARIGEHGQGPGPRTNIADYEDPDEDGFVDNPEQLSGMHLHTMRI